MKTKKLKNSRGSDLFVGLPYLEVDEARLMTRQSVARYCEISVRTVIRWEQAGLLRAYDLGNGLVRYRRCEVDALIESKARK